MGPGGVNGRREAVSRNGFSPDKSRIVKQVAYKWEDKEWWFPTGYDRAGYLLGKRIKDLDDTDEQKELVAYLEQEVEVPETPEADSEFEWFWLPRCYWFTYSKIRRS